MTKEKAIGISGYPEDRVSGYQDIGEKVPDIPII